MSYQSTKPSRSVWGFKGSPHAIQRIFYLCLALSDQFCIRKVLIMLWLISVSYLLTFQFYLTRLCSFVHECMNMVWWSPCSITLYVCRVPSDVGSASPCRHLNFSPHSVLHCECLHPFLLSLSCALSLLIHLLPPSSYSPITSTTHPSHPHTRV